MTLDPRLLEILACPKDKGPLLYFSDEDSLYNPRLRIRYSITDGIPVMLIDEAEQVDQAEHDRLLAKARAEGIAPTFEASGPAGAGGSTGGGADAGDADAGPAGAEG